MKKRFIVLVAAIMAVCYFSFFMPKAVSGDKNVTLKINYAENNYEYKLSTNGNTVLELLEEYNDIYNLGLVTENSSYGAYITSLKGVSQDNEKGYYYSYTLNGGYADGISIQTIKDGDVIVFNYSHTVYDENWNVLSDNLMGKGETATYIKVAIILFTYLKPIMFSDWKNENYEL